MTGESSLPKRLLELLPVLAAMVFHAITFERWLLVIPAGAKVVRFVPPLIVTEADVDEALRLIDQTLSKMA